MNSYDLQEVESRWHQSAVENNT